MGLVLQLVQLPQSRSASLGEVTRQGTLRVSRVGVVGQDKCLATGENGCSLSQAKASRHGPLQVSLKASGSMLLAFTSQGQG